MIRHRINQYIQNTEVCVERLLNYFSYKFEYFTEADEWLRSAKNKHEGERCFILATGPSLSNVDLTRLKGEICFGVNGIYKLAHEIDIAYFVYVSNWYWKHHCDGLKNVPCTRRFIPRSIPELASDRPTTWLNTIDPKYYSRHRGELPVPAGFSFHPDRYIFAGGTVLFLCLQLAYYMGFKTVITLGLDHSYRKQEDHLAKQHGGYMHAVNYQDTAHFDKEYVPGGIAYHVDLAAMERGYEIANNAFLKDGRAILNASPGTHLDTFEKVAYGSLF